MPTENLGFFGVGGSVLEGGGRLRDRFGQEEQVAPDSGVGFGSPFKEVVPAMKERLDEVVRRLGQEPSRLEDDVPSEIAFRRLLAWGRIVEDADHRFIEDMAGTGVPLGVRGEIPWIEAVYDKKHGSEEAGAIQWA